MPTEATSLLGRVWGGVLTVLGDVTGLVVAADQRTYWLYLVSAFVIAVIVAAVGRKRWSLWESARRWTSSSARVDYLLIVAKPIVLTVFALPWALTAHAIALGIVRGLDQTLGAHPVGGSPLLISLGYTLVLFVAWDLSRYLLHRAMHRFPLLWAFHQVHHSAEVLTPFSLHRVHPVESALYQLRGLLVTGLVTGVFFYLFRDRAVEVELLGINVLGMAFNAIGGNLRHSHVWWRWGIAERWFVSPAQHQLHHAKQEPGQRINYGTWLSIWDRLCGSWVAAPKHPPRAFGLDAYARNHRFDSALSALLDPCWAAIGIVARSVLGRTR